MLLTLSPSRRTAAGMLEAIMPLLHLHLNLFQRCEEEIEMLQDERANAIRTVQRQLGRISTHLQACRCMDGGMVLKSPSCCLQ